MAESKLQYIVSAVIALAVTVGVPLLVNSKQAVREMEDSSLADMVSASLNGYMDGDDSLICALVSIKRTGSGDNPVGVHVLRADDGRETFYSWNEQIPVVPGAVMDAPVHTFLRRRKSLKAGEKLPSRENLIPMLTGSWDDFTDRFNDYFGSSDAYYLPRYWYRGIELDGFASIVDGSGLQLSQGQILTFYDAIANGGVRARHRYFRERRICPEGIAGEMGGILRENVKSGVGKPLASLPVPVSGAAGSGVLRVGFVPGAGNVQETGPLNVSSFVGYFPSDKPRYTMCVSLYGLDGAQGTEAALKVFGSIVRSLENQKMI